MRFYRNGHFLFNLLILSFVLSLLFLTLGYDKTTRMLPLIALVPATALSLYCIAGVFFPSLLSRTNLSLMGTGMEKIETDKVLTKGASLLVGTRGLLIITAWLIGFTILIVLVGYFISIPIALFIFFRFVGRYSWLRSTIMAGAIIAFIYVIFNVVMKVNLFDGIIFGGLFIL